MNAHDPLREGLQQGMQALGLSTDPAVVSTLLAYVRLLERWNRVYNLTALRAPGEMLTHHLLDSLAVVPPLNRYWGEHRAKNHANQIPTGLTSTAPHVIDVGSGGGLPGVVIAITQPTWQITCVDAVGKKVGFIRQVAAELALSNLRAVHGRIEDVQLPPANIITARAFSTLSELVRLTRRLLVADGSWAAMKGHVPIEEQAALPGDIAVFHVEQLIVPGLDGQRCLVWMHESTARTAA